MFPLTAEVSVSFFLPQNASHLRVGYGERVHPHAPPSPLVLDGMVKQNAEDVVNHLGDLLLIRVLRVDVAEGEHPVLPYGALEQASARHTTAQSIRNTSSNLCKPDNKYV